MNVNELTRELKRFPGTSIVGIQDCDAGTNELSARVVAVREFDPRLCKISGASREESQKFAKGVRVVIVAG